ncbi:MAG: hypothetical protein H6760_04695 [Candidatus Nomurabacteria bacterium]|nr:MAG: hypothetical protein H6760_04695 [Candidatus Nomurabacteria bacterium]
MEKEAWWYKIYRIFCRTPFLTGLLIMMIALVIASYLQLHDAFADPDSFYHARMATLVADKGFFTQFPWLPFTSLSENYINQHFLYHVILIPFVSIADPLVGIKVATILLTAVMAGMFYGLLRSFQVRWAFVFTLLLLFVNPFMFRMGLPKAPVLGVTLLLAGLWLVFHFRAKWAFVYSWIFVWVYGGFSLLLVCTAVFCLVGLVRYWILHQSDSRSLLTRLHEQYDRWRHHEASWRLYITIGLAVGGGMLAGLLLNPSFPHNIRFYEYQLFKIGIINAQHSIGVGGEWYPYHIGELIPTTIFVSIVVVLGIFGMALQLRKQSVRSWTLFLLTIFFFLLTLKSKRYVEYYVPIGMLFGAFSISDALSGKAGKALLRDVVAGWRHSVLSKTVAVIILAYVVIGVVGVGVRDLRNVRRDLAGGQDASTLSGVGTWLKANAPSDEIVVHSDWDEFPLLFYYDPSHRYIAGLDPTFLYAHDEDRYWAWVDLTTGKSDPSTVSTTLRDTFHASYVVVTKDHVAMDRLVDGTEGVSLVYEDKEAKIYAVAP